MGGVPDLGPLLNWVYTEAKDLAAQRKEEVGPNHVLESFKQACLISEFVRAVHGRFPFNELMRAKVLADLVVQASQNQEI